MEDGLKAIGNLDVGVKWAIAAGAAVVTGCAIVVPNQKEKEKAALDLFDRPVSKLTPQERKVAEFQAGHGRWKVRCMETTFIQIKIVNLKPAWNTGCHAHGYPMLLAPMHVHVL